MYFKKQLFVYPRPPVLVAGVLWNRNYCIRKQPKKQQNSSVAHPHPVQMDEARRSNSKVKQWIRRIQNAPQELPSFSALVPKGNLERIVPKVNMHSIQEEKTARKEAEMKNSLRDVKFTRQRSHSDGNIYQSTPLQADAVSTFRRLSTRSSATPHGGKPAVSERVCHGPKAMPSLPRSNTWGAADSAMSQTAPRTPRPLPSFFSEPAADASPTEHAPNEMSNISLFVLPDVIRTLSGLFGSDTADDTHNNPRTTTFPRSQHSIPGYDLVVSEGRLFT